MMVLLSPTDISGKARSNPLITWSIPSTNSTQGRPNTFLVDMTIYVKIEPTLVVECIRSGVYECE